MSATIHSSPVGVPSNPAAVAVASPAPGAVAPAATPAPVPSAAPAAAPPAAVEPAASPAPAAGADPAKPDGNLLGDALKDGEAKPAADPTDPAKPAEEPAKAAEPLKAEDYKFELPKGIDETNPLFTPFREAAAKNGLTNEAAQALLNEVGPALAEQLQAPHKAWESLQAEWQTKVKTDPELGGAKLPETVARVTGLLRQFGHPDLPAALAISGMGNNPALIFTLNKLALRVMEGTRPEIGGAPATNGAAPAAGSRSLYHSTTDGVAPRPGG